MLVRIFFQEYLKKKITKKTLVLVQLSHSKISSAKRALLFRAIEVHVKSPRREARAETQQLFEVV